MSDFIEAAKSARPRTAIKPPTPKAPLVDTSKLSPSMGMLADVVNNTAAPFQQGPDPKRGDAGWVEHKIGAVMGIVGAPFELLDTGFALVTAPLAALMPGFPAAVLGMPHLGTMHGHAHPPSLIPPNPVPTPLPSIGTVLCAGCVSVTIGGVFAARAGDLGLALTCFSFGPPFEIYTGSSNTWIGGSRAARMLDITRHCNPASKLGLLGAAMGAVGVAAGFIGSEASSNGGEALQASMQAAQAAADAVALAMSALLGIDPGLPPSTGAILLGNPTVLIGGFPVPDLLDLLGGLLKGLKKVGSKIGNSPAFKKLIAKVGLCNDKGEPVSSFTGAVYNDFHDYETTSGFVWGRHYKSSWNFDDGPLGYGFRHFFDRRLELLRTRAVYETHDGEVVAFPREPRGGFLNGGGFELTRIATGRYQLTTDRDEELEFIEQPTSPPMGRLVRFKKAPLELFLHYDDRGRLRTITQAADAFAVDTRFVYDESGRIIEVQYGPREATPQIISRYVYDNGCLVAWQDAIGATVRMRYDGARRMVQGTDRRGYSFHWQYDAYTGRCIKAHGDDGLWGIEARYAGDTSFFKEADGGEWTFKHFPDGIVSHVIDPLGGVLEYVRDKETGRIVEQITPGGTKYTWLYDEKGKHYGRADPFGHVLPPEDEDADPPNPLGHDGPTTPKEFLLGRPLSRLSNALGGLPTAVRQRIETELQATAPQRPLSEPTRNALGLVTEQPERDGSTLSFRYDAEGNVIAEQDTAGAWTQNAYASWNLLSQQTSALGHTTRYEHTHRGEKRAIIDPNGNRTEYVRDPLHRVTEIHRYGRLYRRYLYDAHDAVIEEQDSSGNGLVKYETGAQGLHVAATLASGERYSYAYDARGRFTLASSTQHEVMRRHTRNLRELDLRDDKGVRHEYASTDWLRRTTVLERFVTHYHYSGSSRVRITTPDGSAHLLWRQQNLCVRENANGTREASVFDGNDLLSARACWRENLSTHGPSWLVSYRYDARSNLLFSVDSDSGPAHFQYDADHRIIAQHDQRGERRYAYDAAGNLTRAARHQLVEYDPGNLVQHADFDHFEHDERCRRAKHDRQGGTVVTYLYDSRDQLIEARWSNRSELWRATYDGLGRRLWREYGGRRTDFYWDGDRLAAERDPDGRLRIYVYPNEDALVPFMWLDYANEGATPESGKPSYLFTAPTGMPLRVEDAHGFLVWRAQGLDAYGEFDESPGAECPTRLRFAGHFFDEHLGLFYNRFRDYDPVLGRYLQPDRLGHAGGINLFTYPSNPLVAVDLRGLMHFDDKGKKKGKGNQSEDATPTKEEIEAQKQKQREAEAKRLAEKTAEAQKALDDMGPIGPKARAELEAIPGGKALLDNIDATTDPIKKLEQTQVAAVALETHRSGEHVTAIEKPYKNPDGSDLTKTDVETDKSVVEVKGKDLSNERSLNSKATEQATNDRKIARDSDRDHVIRAPSANDDLKNKIEKRGTKVDRRPFPYDGLKE